MKHTAFKFPPYTEPIPRPMTDRDWEDYVQKLVEEEADFYNATSHLMETSHVRYRSV